MTRLAGALFLSVGLVSSALSSDDTEETDFSAELISIHSILKFEGRAVLAGFRPKFVASYKLVDEVTGLGKKDEIIAFAIHSPIRELGVDISDLKSFVGKTHQLKLTTSESKSGYRHYLRRLDHRAAW